MAESTNVKEQVASSLLGEMAPNKDGDVALKTGGRRLRDRLSPKDKEANILTHEQMDKFHSKVTKRDKRSKLLGQGIRKIYGRKSVTPYYAEMKIKRKKKSASFLDIISLKFKGRADTKIACVIKNSQDYVEHLKLKRNVTDPHVKFGLDGGREWEKVALSLQDKKVKPPSSVSQDLFEGDFKDAGKYRIIRF